jgi:hypothetical protein
MNDYRDRDPGEAIWQAYFEAAIAAGEGQTIAVSKDKADKAYAEHCERWPRERKVVPLNVHEEVVEAARLKTAEHLIEVACQTARPAMNNLEHGPESRKDAAQVLRSFVEALGTLIGQVERRAFYTGHVTWICPPIYDEGADYRLPERALPAIRELIASTKKAQSLLSPEESLKISQATQELERAIWRSEPR